MANARELVDQLPSPIDPDQRWREIQEDVAAVTRTGTSDWQIIAAAVIAGLVGRYTGRRRAALENTVIGGIYAGFSAYRDPRDSWWLQLIVAAGQGAAWGLTDVYFPELLDMVSGRAGDGR